MLRKRTPVVCLSNFNLLPEVRVTAMLAKFQDVLLLLSCGDVQCDNNNGIPQLFCGQSRIAYSFCREQLSILHATTAILTCPVHIGLIRIRQEK